MPCTAYSADLRLMGGRQKFASAHVLGSVRTRPAVSLNWGPQVWATGSASSVVIVIYSSGTITRSYIPQAWCTH